MSETINVPGMGEVPSPQHCREQKDGRKQTLPINAECPVCGAGPYNTFAKLRGHFGNRSADAAHRSHDLDIEDYR